MWATFLTQWKNSFRWYTLWSMRFQNLDEDLVLNVGVTKYRDSCWWPITRSQSSMAQYGAVVVQGEQHYTEQLQQILMISNWSYTGTISPEQESVGLILWYDVAYCCRTRDTRPGRQTYQNTSHTSHHITESIYNTNRRDPQSEKQIQSVLLARTLLTRETSIEMSQDLPLLSKIWSLSPQ